MVNLRFVYTTALFAGALVSAEGPVQQGHIYREQVPGFGAGVVADPDLIGRDTSSSTTSSGHDSSSENLSTSNSTTSSHSSTTESKTSITSHSTTSTREEESTTSTEPQTPSDAGLSILQNEDNIGSDPTTADEASLNQQPSSETTLTTSSEPVESSSSSSTSTESDLTVTSTDVENSIATEPLSTATDTSSTQSTEGAPSISPTVPETNTTLSTEDASTSTSSDFQGMTNEFLKIAQDASGRSDLDVLAFLVTSNGSQWNYTEEGGFGNSNITWSPDICKYDVSDNDYWFALSWLFSPYLEKQPCRYKYCRALFNSVFPQPTVLDNIRKTVTKTLYTPLETSTQYFTEGMDVSSTVETKWTKGLGTTVISALDAWWGQAGNEPCCADCRITAGTIDLRYWDPISPEPTTPVTRVEQHRDELWTYTYPSIYFAFDYLYAQDGCSTVGGQHAHKMFGFDPSEISSVSPHATTDWNGPATGYGSYSIDWAAFHRMNCSTIVGYSYDPNDPINLQPERYDPCNPRIAVPPGLATRIDPAWASCHTQDQMRGFYDPPRALYSQENLLAPPAPTASTTGGFMATKPTEGSAPPPPTPAPTRQADNNSDTDTGTDERPDGGQGVPDDDESPKRPGVARPDQPQQSSGATIPVGSPDQDQAANKDNGNPSQQEGNPRPDTPSRPGVVQPQPDSPADDSAPPSPEPLAISWINSVHTDLAPTVDSSGNAVIAGQKLDSSFSTILDGKPVKVQNDGALYWGDTLLGVIQTPAPTPANQVPADQAPTSGKPHIGDYVMSMLGGSAPERNDEDTSVNSTPTAPVSAPPSDADEPAPVTETTTTKAENSPTSNDNLPNNVTEGTENSDSAPPVQTADNDIIPGSPAGSLQIGSASATDKSIFKIGFVPSILLLFLYVL